MTAGAVVDIRCGISVVDVRGAHLPNQTAAHPKAVGAVDHLPGRIRAGDHGSGIRLAHQAPRIHAARPGTAHFAAGVGRIYAPVSHIADQTANINMVEVVKIDNRRRRRQVVF